MTTSLQHSASEIEEREPPFAPAIVEGWLLALSKAVRAHQLYLPNNPVYQRAIDAVRAAFQTLWAETDEVTLAITESELKWEGRVVASETTKSESLAWLLYKDGLRELTLIRGFEGDEFDRLLALLQRVKRAAPDEDDLLTLLWEQDFVNMRYQFVEFAPEGIGEIVTGDSYGVERQVDVQATEAAAEAEAPQAAGIVSMTEFDSTVYFLDEHEIEFVRNALHDEYQEHLSHNVLCVLFDLFERQTDEGVRDEIIESLELLMLHFLAAGDYRAVAFLVRESRQVSERATDIEQRHREGMLRVPDRLGSPEVLGQLLQTIADATTPPEPAELDALFEVLGGAAMETVLRWIVHLPNGVLRTALERASTRLSASNVSELVRLIGLADREVALEAARRAGELRSPGAVAALGRLLGLKDTTMRLVGAQALAAIASPGALQHLERAVEDPDREVRIVAVRVLGAKGHRAALPKLEAQVRGTELKDADLTEKMAYYEAYGALAGERAVSQLDATLNGKGLFGRRDDAETRACAAMALGRIGSAAALDALRKAAQDKEMIVRNAVQKAMRGAAA
ncbi:MAG TPA: HEAT repeat domain-containing protein [Gemmatimonadaceae bacterium]|nr:HEAT repeat domain-containing protein [Gemmatimonadaceae bacterium]